MSCFLILKEYVLKNEQKTEYLNKTYGCDTIANKE